MKLNNLGLKLFAVLAAFMIYYGFYSRLKRVVQANLPEGAAQTIDTPEFRNDTVRW